MSNTSEVIGSNGNPDPESALNRSKAPFRSGLLFMESRMLNAKSGPKFGINSLSIENDRASLSENDEAKPNATAI